MPRAILDEQRLHPDIRNRVAGRHRALVDEVEAAVRLHPVVVVGMAGNPHCWRARRLLRESGVGFEYLGYGSYLSQWRRRNALKMWTGWPTLPMVFVRGRLVGGASDLAALLQRGELAALLAAEPPPPAEAGPPGGGA